MKKSNVKNVSKEENSDSRNILESIFFYDVDSSNAEEVKKRWNIIRRIFRIIILILIVFICGKIIF